MLRPYTIHWLNEFLESISYATLFMFIVSTIIWYVQCNVATCQIQLIWVWLWRKGSLGSVPRSWFPISLAVVCHLSVEAQKKKKKVKIGKDENSYEFLLFLVESNCNGQGKAWDPLWRSLEAWGWVNERGREQVPENWCWFNEAACLKVQLQDWKKTKTGPDPNRSRPEIIRTDQDCNRSPVFSLPALENYKDW